MNILKKLFGGGATAQGVSAKSKAPIDPANDPNMIRVFDGYGREVFITRKEWRDNVLPGAVKKHWDDPQELYSLIFASLNDGFFEEMVKPAERLAEIDQDAERGAVLLAIVYLKVKRLEDSEEVLRGFIRSHGETGVVLTNLAKIYAERGDDPKTMETLWRGLQLDPNQDNGLGWYEVIHREQGGDTAGLDALRRIAGIPGSWRAQLWLARAELKVGNVNEALLLYRESIARAGRPAPGGMLMQISGDLGNAGHLAEILQLVEPEFEPSAHGLPVGNNLIKAHLDLRQVDEARRILDQLFALKRPDWAANLSYWDTEIAKARIAAGAVDEQTKFSVEMLCDDGPVWLRRGSPAADLFPGRGAEGPVVTFLGSTAEIANGSKTPQQQLSNPPGRMSRALPLFLAEQVELRCGVRSQTLVPWIVEPSAGFLLSGTPWSNQDAVDQAQRCEVKSRYVAVSHVIVDGEQWEIEAHLIRTSDSQCVGSLRETFQEADPTQAVIQLADRLVELLCGEMTIQVRPVPVNYALPERAQFLLYLLRLEQLLAVRCGSLENTPAEFLSGEREIIDGNIRQCLDTPGSVSARILLAQTLLAMKRVRPQVVGEFKERVALLQKERPLAEPAGAIVQSMLDEALAT